MQFFEIFSVILNNSATSVQLSCGFCLDFPDNILEYLDEWTRHLNVFNEFAWIFLDSFPDWATVKKAIRVVEEKGEFDMTTHSAAVFTQFGHAKNFCSNDKLAQWRANKVSTEKRWVELFQHMQAKNVPFNEFATIVEFILCFPGTSAPAERIFAKAKKIWKVESARLQMSSLDSILQVKCNMEWSCIDFYDFLKTQPELLRKISSQEKYNFKGAIAPATATVGDSPMSVQQADSDESL